MKAVAIAAFGLLVPGGVYLPARRYAQFAGFAALVWVTFAAGLALHGGYQWPQAADLQGMDAVAALTFKAGALARILAGAPFLLAQLLGSPHGFFDGRLHEYGTTLLTLAGLFNLMAASSAFELRKAAR